MGYFKQIMRDNAHPIVESYQKKKMRKQVLQAEQERSDGARTKDIAEARRELRRRICSCRDEGKVRGTALAN